MKKLLKRLTIRKRAYFRGCRMKDEELGWLFTDSPRQQNVFRTMIRLQRIRCGIKPFTYTTGNIGDVFVTDYALRAYGNLKANP